MKKTHAAKMAVGFSLGPFRKLVFSLALMILVAGVVIFLSWQMTSKPEPSENQSPGGPENFRIFVSGDAHLDITTSSYPEVISQPTEVTVENTTENHSKTVTLDYSSSVQGDWLDVELSPQSGAPTFTSTVTVRVDTGYLQGYTGTFQLTITGTNSDNVSHGVPIQVTIE